MKRAIIIISSRKVYTWSIFLSYVSSPEGNVNVHMISEYVPWCPCWAARNEACLAHAVIPPKDRRSIWSVYVSVYLWHRDMTIHIYKYTYTVCVYRYIYIGHICIYNIYMQGVLEETLIFKTSDFVQFPKSSLFPLSEKPSGNLPVRYWKMLGFHGNFMEIPWYPHSQKGC